MVLDPQTVRLRSATTVEADSLLPPHGARVSVDLADGRRLQTVVEHCVGSPGAPMSDEALQAKLVDQCEPVIGRRRAEALAARCWRVLDLDDAAELARASC
jgi:2-methylcitrate dehydratase PrpD